MTESKYVYFDGRLSAKSRQARKSPDVRTIVTFNPLTGRIYFSAGAYQRFELANHRITIVQEAKKPENLWLYLDDTNGFEVINHRWCYYFTSKDSVARILGEEVSDPVEYNISTRPMIVDGHQMFKLQALDSEGTSPKPTKTKTLLDNYKKTDFPGRIKTVETLEAEKVLLEARI